MISTSRRLLLKIGLLLGTLGAAASLLPRLVWAAWPKAAFELKQVPETLQNLFGQSELIESDEIDLNAPDLAENGAVVPVTISSTLTGIESIIILVDKNPNALVARFDLPENTQAYIKTTIKMAETSNIIAVLKSGDKLYSTRKKVKVSLNGCSH